MGMMSCTACSESVMDWKTVVYEIFSFIGMPYIQLCTFIHCLRIAHLSDSL